MWAEFQGAVVTVLEERLAINAEKFSCLLGRDPAGVLSHGSDGSYSFTLQAGKSVSTALNKSLSLFL